MPKLLRAVRLDDSDEQVFRECGAARDGEWVTTAGFAVRDAMTGDSFMAVASPARCTIAEVAEATDEELAEVIEAFAWELARKWNAPSFEAARSLAEEELRHTAEVCETLAPEVWITVKRSRLEDGNLEEQYCVYDRLLIGAHNL
jgi:uncharacterized protein DUF6505